MNITPLIGVFIAGWSAFALFFIYWLETLGMSFITAIKILTAQQPNQRSLNIFEFITFIGLRLFILVFYFSFILVFSGIVVSSGEEYDKFIRHVRFSDPSFRLTMITFFMIKIAELLSDYFLSGDYKQADVNKLNLLFEPRMLLIHLQLVLGLISFMFLNHFYSEKIGMIAFTLVFVLLKTSLDYFTTFRSDNRIK